MPSQKSQLKAYVEKEKYDKIKEIADKNYRTLSKQLEFIIDEFIKNYEDTNKND